MTGYRLTRPVAFNDSDWVVGQAGENAAYWDGDTTRIVPVVNAAGSVATAISNFGDVTGRLISNIKPGRGFAWFNVASHLLPYQEISFFTDNISPTSINDNRWIIGYYSRSDIDGNAWHCLDCQSGFWFRHEGTSWPYSRFSEYELREPEFYEDETGLLLSTPVMVTNNKRTLGGSWKGLFLAYQDIGDDYLLDTLTLHSLPPPAGYSDPRNVIWLDMNEQDDVVGRVGEHGVAVIDRLTYNLNCSSNLPAGTIIKEARGITDGRTIIVNGTIGGVARGFMLGTNLTGVEDQPVSVQRLPKMYTLYQNYPNPFNPATAIQFEIPNASYVTLKVYSVLGQEVATLVNENKEAGRYEVQFDGSKLGSGVYFYRLNARMFTETKKLLLLK